jgi:hypothetical protein
VEKGNVVDQHGQVVQKGSEQHAAVVIGDTVGDPFKDTSGPSLNVLVKLMALVSLVLAPRLRSIYRSDADQQRGFRPYGVLVSACVAVVLCVAAHIRRSCAPRPQ